MTYRFVWVAAAVLLAGTGCTADPVTSPEAPATDPVPSTLGSVTISTTPPVTTPTATSVATTTTVAAEPTVPPVAWDTWTLIYASLDVDEHSRDDAVAIAATIDGGFVLRSDDYPSLNGGYWVVAAGEWHDRYAAGNGCPATLDPGVTCYPRYLGPDLQQLLADGAAVAQIAGRLVVMDPTSAEILATFSDSFHDEASFPAGFGLTADASALFFGLGWEDSWYACESDQGDVRRLDLDTGIEDVFADGWSPAISPDGRWLAVVAAEKCYPDPEVSSWVVTPGSQVEIFDLAAADKTPSAVLRPAVPPVSYDDPQGVRAVRWDPASPGDLLVWLADDSVRRIAYDSTSDLDKAPIEYRTDGATVAAVGFDRVYFIDWEDESSTVQIVDRASGDVIETLVLDSWISAITLNSAGEVLMSTWGHLILPSGEQLPVAGINNLVW